MLNKGLIVKQETFIILMLLIITELENSDDYKKNMQWLIIVELII